MKNNQKHNRAVIRRVPLSTIVKAKNGDDTALEKILRHYQGYMLKLSQFELYDAIPASMKNYTKNSNSNW